MKMKILYALGIIACLFTIDKTDIDININQNNENLDRYKLEDYEVTKDSSNKISVKINGQASILLTDRSLWWRVKTARLSQILRRSEFCQNTKTV